MASAQRRLERPADSPPANAIGQKCAPPAFRQGPAGNGRCDRDSQNERPDQHGHHCNGDGADKVSGRSWQQNHRRERKRRGQRRSQQRREKPANGLPYGDDAFQAVTNSLADLVGHDDRGIDKQTECHDQAGDRHLVDGKSDCVQRRQSCQTDDRQDQCDDQRRPCTQRDEQHDHHQCDTDCHVETDFGQSFGRIAALIEYQVGGNRCRQALHLLAQRLAYMIHPDIHLNAILYPRGNQYGRLAIIERIFALRQARAACDGCDIAQKRCTAGCIFPNDNPAQTIERSDFTLDADKKIAVGTAQAAGLYLGIGGTDGSGNLIGRKAKRRCEHGIDADQHLLFRRTVDLDQLGSGNIAQRVGQIL